MQAAPAPRGRDLSRAVPLDDLFIPEPNSGCWLWLGSRDRSGYGLSHGRAGEVMAHRSVYRVYVGEIPEGLTLDHRCDNRACVNPGHLKPETFLVNVLRSTSPTAINARKEVCPRHGTPYEHAYGQRICRRCRRATVNKASRAYRDRRATEEGRVIHRRGGEWCRYGHLRVYSETLKRLICVECRREATRRWKKNRHGA